MNETSDPLAIDNDLRHLQERFREPLVAAISLANHDSRHPDGTAKVYGFKVWALFEGLRSKERQQALYAQGRTHPGSIVTYLRHSRHEDGTAADVIWIDDQGHWRWDGPEELWNTLGHCARAQGLTWGGDWQMHDTPHIQLDP